MSVRLEILQVARLAPRLLGESASSVANFINARLNADGGFAARAGASDLYYTVFGLQALAALSLPPPTSACARYLRHFGDGGSLDLVHVTCLARCWAMLPAGAGAPPADALLQRVEAHRAADGGYAPVPGAQHGTSYHAYLAVGAYQDLNASVPDPQQVVEAIAGLRAADGAYANTPGQPLGSTPATAAAVAVLRQLGAGADASLSAWLFGRCRDGGFFAAPHAPMPDLLSTATALHTLDALHASIDRIREPCIDFIDSLWTSEGAFFGSWADDTADCEYTFYGLLALGHLAL